MIAPSNEPEAFGRVAAEAGAMGVPAVGSSIGAQGEIIVDGEDRPDRSAIATPTRCPTAMASLLAMGPDGRRAMGEAALTRVRRAVHNISASEGDAVGL